MKLLRELGKTEAVLLEPANSPAIERLKTAKAWIFDMDGVLYRGNAPLPGAVDLFATLQLRNTPFRLATNNSTLTPEQYVKKLEKMDLEVPADWIITSGVATREYLLTRFPKGAPIYVVGEPALFEQLFVTDDLIQANGTDLQAIAVVAGLDRKFTYDKLSEAHNQIQNGAAFVATNSDVTLADRAWTGAWLRFDHRGNCRLDRSEAGRRRQAGNAALRYDRSPARCASFGHRFRGRPIGHRHCGGKPSRHRDHSCPDRSIDPRRDRTCRSAARSRLYRFERGSGRRSITSELTMRLTKDICLVGGGNSGFGLSAPLDCHVYVIDGGSEAAIVDAGMGGKYGATEQILANIEECRGGYQQD